MPGTPRRVFLSYTSELAKFPHPDSFVRHAEKAVTRAQHVIAGMDTFGPRDDRPANVCIDAVAEAGIYVGLIGLRYGSPVVDRPDLSYVQLELDTAVSRRIPIFILLLDEEAEVPYNLMVADEPSRMERQRSFRNHLRNFGRVIDTFRNGDELETRLYQALMGLPDSEAGEHLLKWPLEWQRAKHVSYAQLGLEQQLGGGSAELFSIAISRDRGLVAAGSDGEVLIWRRDDPSHPDVVEGYGKYVYSVAFSPDGATLASGDEDGAVRVLDVASGKFIWEEDRDGAGHSEGVYSVSFSPDGQFVASGSYDRYVKLWNARTGQLREPLPQRGRVASVAFDRNSRLLAIGSHDNSVTVWNVRTGELLTLSGNASSVESVAFSPTSDLLASGGLDKMVRVWDVTNSKVPWVGRGHEYLVRSVAFSPDGETVASASWDKTVRLWNTATGDCIQQVPWDRKHLPYHTDWIWAVTFSPDGTLLASVGSDGKVILWKVQGADDTYALT